MMKHLLGTTMTLALLALAVPVAQAGPVTYNVSLNTSVLQANNPGQGPFAVDFELNDGNFIADGNNTATISNFTLNGGGTLGAINPDGFPPGSDVTGSLGPTSTLTITDAGALNGINDFNQVLNPGSSLSFTLTLTTNVSPAEASGIPDAFSFSVYSNDFGKNAPSNQPTSPSSLTISITGPNPAVSLNGGVMGNGIDIPPPTLQPAVSTPEPASLTLLAVGLASLAAGRRWQRRRTLAVA